MKLVLPGTKKIFAFLFSVFFLTFSLTAQSQVTECFTRVGNKPLVNLSLVPDITIFDQTDDGKGRLRGFIEYLPNDYNEERNYGLIIFFHGMAAVGNGSGNQTTSGLCNIITDAWNTIIGLVDNMVPSAPALPDYIMDNYIILAPQYPQYFYSETNPSSSNFPGADAVEAMIDFALNRYANIDEEAIVLTGLSSGANMISEYLSSSTTRANRIAHANIISNCTQIGVDPIISEAAENIANSTVNTWFVACSMDQTCEYPLTTLDWVNEINALNPVNPAVLTEFSNPDDCLIGTFHNAWTTFYRPEFNRGPDGMNLYEYIETFASVNATLPVTLKAFNVRLQNNKVILDWQTASESNNAYFAIERSGEDMNFKEIARVNGKVNSSEEASYRYEDATPLTGISYYRLVQADLDGKTKTFQVKKIVNTPLGSKLVVSPNPFNEKLSVYINLPSAKNLSVYITDMNGRRLIAYQQVFREGSQEVQLNTSQLQRGIYFLRIEGDGISESRKILKK